MHILLIEDDPVVAQSVRLLLEAEKFQVWTSPFGEEGVDLGKLNSHDLILLDLNLPDMSGYDVLQSSDKPRCKHRSRSSLALQASKAK